MSVVTDVSLAIRAGEFFGLIGETGAGKSMTAWSAVGLVQPPGRITKGRVLFEGRDLLSMDERTLRQVRGNEVAIIVQNARAALNPMLSIGVQISNAYRAHHDVGKREAMVLAVDALRTVGIPDPEDRAGTYPHQLSGGMAQRALIALAMVNRPRLLIADEPTTGLDVTIQAEILDLMAELVAARGSSVWIITHDLGVIANHTERAAVMFAGQIVETGTTHELFTSPRHPYTQELVEATRHERSGDERNVGSPDLANRPIGCQFTYRCPQAEDDCFSIMPTLDELAPGHHVRCLVAQRAVSKAEGR
jgi:oligopeptide/dipeptide ABC transporter ATP-binding protein